VFGGLMDEVDRDRAPAAARMTQAQLYGIVNAIRLQESTYKSAGSVHGCALFRGEDPDAAVRRGRRPPQRHRHHRRLDVDARGD
jgi:formate dehydrogenase assembly factor FdhD